MSPRAEATLRRDKVSEVYERVRDLIVRGRVAPGVRLIEAQIVERLGVSRTSVRAALQRLQQEGYVMGATAGRRTRPIVTPLTDDDARELFSMVAEIEGLAAERAAGLVADPRGALVEALTAVNADYSRAARAEWPDGDELFALDTTFHRLYVEAGGGPRLVALHDAIKPQIERYVRVYQTALHDAIATSVVEHDAIVAEIRKGSGQGAQEAVRTNWRNAAQRLRAVIGTRGEAGNW